MDHYHNDLNPNLVTSVLQVDNSPTLLGWIQLVCERIIERIHLMQQVSQQQLGGSVKVPEKPKPCMDAPLEREQQFQQGRCLHCGAVNRFATKCPASAMPSSLGPACPGRALNARITDPHSGVREGEPTVPPYWSSSMPLKRRHLRTMSSAQMSLS